MPDTLVGAEATLAPFSLNETVLPLTGEPPDVNVAVRLVVAPYVPLEGLTVRFVEAGPLTVNCAEADFEPTNAVTVCAPGEAFVGTTRVHENCGLPLEAVHGEGDVLTGDPSNSTVTVLLLNPCPVTVTVEPGAPEVGATLMLASVKVATAVPDTGPVAVTEYDATNQLGNVN